MSALCAELLNDLNADPSAAGSEARTFVPFGSLALFQASDGSRGHELWVTDGTSDGTRLLADVWPGAMSSAPGPTFGIVGNLAFFTADDETNFRELWVTDGTPTGTRIVVNMTPNQIEDRDNPPAFYGGNFPVAGQLAFYRRNEARRGELWRTDGTAQGTVRFAELPVSDFQAVADFEMFGNHAYFRWHANVSGEEYWQTDGTTAGTRLVADLRAGVGSSMPGDLVIAGANAYFLADDGLRGREIWLLPAPGAAPVAVPDLVPGAAGIGNAETAAHAGRLVLAGTPQNPGIGVHCIAGTAVTTLAPDGFRAVSASGRLYFFRLLGGTLRLWLSDCTTAGTREVADIGPLAPGAEVEAAAAGGNLVFQVDHGDGTGARLHGSDGTVAGTVQIGLVGPRFPETPFAPFFPGGQSAFFLAEEQLVGNLPGGSPPLSHSLWRTDGTAAGTVRIAGGFFRADGIPFAAFHNGLLYLRVADPVWGDEIFVSDGNAGDWSLLRDINPGVLTDGSSPKRGLEVDGLSYFVASDIAGRRLWRTDGTSAGTAQVDLGGVSPDALARGLVGRRIVYLGIVESTGFEPYAYDIDTGVNELLADIGPGQLSGSSGTCNNSLPMAGGRILFNAFDGDRNGIYATDGTPGGTVRLFPIGSPMETLTICYWTEFAGGIVFGDGQQSLWRTDGTAAGTERIFDAGFAGWVPERLTASNGLVYFSAFSLNAPVSKQLWRTDGTTPGTAQIGDLPREPINITPLGALAVFRVCLGGIASCNLYASDGSAQGTRRLSELLVEGPSPELPLPVWRGQVHVYGIDAQGSPASKGIHSSDGQTLVRSVPLGPSVNQRFLPVLAFADRLIGLNPRFTAEVGGTFIRFDLWVSDGTTPGTRPLATFPGGRGIDAEPFSPLFSRPGAFWQLDSTLIFSADDGIRGFEPWIMPATRPSASADSFTAAASGQTALEVLANDGFIGSPLDPATVEIVDAPLFGVATVNTSTGAILYTPSAGTGGMDELSYRVRDTQGQVSNVARVAVLVMRATGPAPPPPPGQPPPPNPPPPGGGGGGGGALALIEIPALLALWLAVGAHLRLRRRSLSAEHFVAVSLHFDSRARG